MPSLVPRAAHRGISATFLGCVVAFAMLISAADPAGAKRRSGVVATTGKATAGLPGQPAQRLRRGSRASAARPHRVKFGVHTDEDPYMGHVRNVDALQDRLGRPIEIVNWYQMWGGDDWTNKVHPDIIRAVTGSGRIPLLTWQPSAIGNGAAVQPAYRLERIARGDFDGLLREWADGLKAVGEVVYLRPMHEMNGNWYPWNATINGNSTAQFRAAWRRMHDIFERRGAHNVRFVWSPLNIDVPAVPSNRMERYYPGHRYVDVLALDGYNWGSGAPDGGGWRSFREVFQEAYERIRRIGPQPIWIAEVATAPQGGDKAAWIRDMWATAARWRRLKAIVWFDIDKERDWRADASSRIASAFSLPSLARRG